MQGAKRAIKNTAYLYVRMLVSIFLTLLSTRILLQALGTKDFGIFNVIAGVVLMFTFLNAALAVSTQRYISFFVGKGELDKLKEIFSASILLHLIMGLFVVIVLETSSAYVINDFLTISSDRLVAAKIVFHCTVVSTFFTINAVPYDAAINANEDMFFDAIVGIAEAILRLGAAYYIKYTVHDGLIVFGIAIMGITILVRIAKSVFCYQKYKDLQFSVKAIKNRALFQEMFSFSAWNLFGSLSSVGKMQGLNVILNIFFGPVANAAYAISNQVSTQLSAFSENMLKAVRPQIIKSEGAGQRDQMLKLTFSSSKIAYLLLSIIAIPMIINMEYVLKLWLGSYPPQTVIFARLGIVVSLINLFTIGIRTAVQATGNIKKYQAVVGSLLILNLPLAYMFLKIGFASHWVFITSIFIEILALGFRVRFLKVLTNIESKSYYKNVVWKGALPTVIILALGAVIGWWINIDVSTIIQFAVFNTIFLIIYLPLIFTVGLTKSERSIMTQSFKGLFNKYVKN